MRDAGVITLQDVPREILDVRCSRCDRTGRYRISTLAERFGDNACLPDVEAALDADCPRCHLQATYFSVFEALSD